MSYKYLVTEQAVTVTFDNGTSKAIARSNAQASQIVTAVLSGVNDREVEELFDKALAVKRYMQGNIEVTEGGEVKFKGRKLGHEVSEKIVAFMRAGIPHEPLVKFLNLLMENPSNRSVNCLYPFLVHQDIQIADDGYLVCYKAVRSDYKDKHSGTYDNSPGAVIREDRNTIDDNPESTCSHGLHAGSIQYVRGFASSGDKIIRVRINPKDVVSVPADHNATKLRVCEYTVIEDVTDQVITDVAKSPLYQDDDDDTTVTCSDCGCVYDQDETDRECPECGSTEDADDGTKTIKVGGTDITVPEDSEVKVTRVNGKLVVTIED